MNTSRKTATIVGVLYIIGTVSGILSVVFTQSILTGPDYMMQVAVHENQIIIGLLFVLTMALALAMVPVMLFPILKKYNEPLALGYLIFRGALETVVYIALVITRLFLIIVGQQYAAAGTPASYLQTLGAVLLAGHDSIDVLLIIIFSLDALMLYCAFYQSKLIPRWISGWGLIAIVMHFSTAFLILFRVVAASDMATLGLISFPILVQEMVMAVWLIVKGFNRSTSAPEPAVQSNWSIV